MLLETLSTPYKRVRQTNASDNGFPSRVPTLTAPSGTGGNAAQATASAVILSNQPGQRVQNVLKLVPYGTGSDGNTFSLRVIAWEGILDPTITPAVPTLWVPTLLCELSVTLSSGNPGIANSLIPATMLFAKTITVTTGNSLVSTEVLSPATSGVLAHAKVDIEGAQLIEVTFTTGGSATDCNALWKLF